jgi:hypothetical protein
MSTIFELKEQALTEAPLILFDCVLPNGAAERWSTHGVTDAGAVYEARVLEHNVFEMQTGSEQGVDGAPQISIVLANADSHFSEIERSTGWKGAQLTVSFLFFDLRNHTAASERASIFRGVCNAPDEITEGAFRITATNRLNLQRLVLPQVRIQRRCPWDFPVTPEQRAEARDGGENEKYSRFYRCGYSAGVEQGCGDLANGTPFTNCGYTRTDCIERGMFARFGGIEFVPPQTSVRTSGDKNWHTSALAVNAARYNDYVPMVYGTAWYAPPVVFARNDGNLTRMEVLLGIGEMQGVLKVLVNDVEIPQGAAGTNMTATGWYNAPTLGVRDGVGNPDFADASGGPAGDPYGSMAYLAIAVPNRLNDGSSLPKVTVLAQGIKTPTYDLAGNPTGEVFTSNPAWILLDILRRMGWKATELDVATFARSAAYCDEPITSTDIYGNPLTLPRFQCNLAIRNRRSAGDVARGVRNAARLLLTYGSGGLLQLRVEDSIAHEQPEKPAWSNSSEPINRGWPSYEFGDGTNGFGGILRRRDGSPSLRIYTRRTSDTPNRFSVEFQDSLNEYQQDSYSVVDSDDVATAGQEISASLSVLGLPNYDQASRIVNLFLSKSVYGNTYVEFETSVKCIGIRPGDLITLTYLKEGYIRQLFRVLKIAPGMNYRTSTITAQIHNDTWYSDDAGHAGSFSRALQRGGGTGVPRPVVGSVLDENGDLQFGVEELATGARETELEVKVVCTPPVSQGCQGPGIPLIGLSPELSAGGALPAGQVFYYAVSANDSAGNESPLSFLVRASIAEEECSVTLTGLSFDQSTASFNVYRGSNPAQLFRIASAQIPAPAFVDSGFPKQTATPPDPSFDHVNYYWRMERIPETAAEVHSVNSIGNSQLEMPDNAYRGLTVRVTRGRGAGQERMIESNSATLLNVSPRWALEPDASSHFTVADDGWRFGAQTATGSAHFEIPNRGGETVQITGRSANVDNKESAPELATVTRWQISGVADQTVAAAPSFALAPGRRGGAVELSSISFSELKNTRSITAATLTLHYRDEVDDAGSSVLAAAVGVNDTELTLAADARATEGDYVQVEGEVMRVQAVWGDGRQYTVQRGCLKSAAVVHETGAAVFKLRSNTAIAPFPEDFFGSPYCADWSYSIPLPNCRVAAAEIFVTNSKGNSAPGAACFTQTAERGIRTLSGGQYSIQVNGYLAVEQDAAPALVVEAPHSVRDVFAILGRAADATVKAQLQVDGAAYCDLDVGPLATLSPSVDGSELPPLKAGQRLSLSILAVGSANPGADLSVVIRL